MDIVRKARNISCNPPFERAFESSRDTILIARQSDRRIVEANAAATRAYGLSRKELLARSLGDLEAEGHRSHLLHCDGAGVLLETAHRRKDGTVFPVEISERETTVEGCRVVISTIRDTSYRIRAEAELKSIAQFPEENPNPVIRADREGRILYLNQPAKSFFKEIEWKSEDTLPAQLSSAVRTVFDEGSSRGEEVTTPRGHVFWFMLAPKQKDGYVNLYASDVTERKMMEENLQRSEERLRALVQAVPAITFEGDAQGNNTFASNGWFEFTGMTAEETAGQGWAKALHPRGCREGQGALVRSIEDRLGIREQASNMPERRFRQMVHS